MSKSIAVILSGCGFKDGSEIHESVLALLHIVKNGGVPRCFAPDLPQPQVINHLTGQPAAETRNMLVEAARIARGQIQDIRRLRPAEFDALVLPGGFGAANNLSTFGSQGERMEVNPEVARVVREFHAQGKPIGAICIAPVIVAKVLGSEHPSLTIGTDAGVAGALQTLGVQHVNCPATGHHADAARKVVTTPAYMLGKTIAEIDAGIAQCIRDVMAMAGQPVTA